MSNNRHITTVQESQMWCKMRLTYTFTCDCTYLHYYLLWPYSIFKAQITILYVSLSNMLSQCFALAHIQFCFVLFFGWSGSWRTHVHNNASTKQSHDRTTGLKLGGHLVSWLFVTLGDEMGKALESYCWLKWVTFIKRDKVYKWMSWGIWQ